MVRSMLSQQTIVQQLCDLGVMPGQLLLVHCAFSQIQPVEGGPAGFIAALLEVVGSEGTLAMPSMTDDVERIFDPHRTPCRHLGIVADTFWRLPHVRRSASPHAFAAYGPLAADITAPHPIDVSHGLDSPVGRIYQHDGVVLLLGVGHDDNTTIHLAEALAGVRYRRRKHVWVSQDDQIRRRSFAEIDHCCANFQRVDTWLEEKNLQARGTVGHAHARLIRSQDIVQVVMRQIDANETVFLHPLGTDDECDEAWASLNQ